MSADPAHTNTPNPSGSTERPAPARFVIGVILCCASLVLLGADAIWALLAQAEVNHDGYAIGAVLLSTLAVAFLIGGGAILVFHLIRRDVTLAREAHAAGLIAIEAQSQAVRAEIRAQARAGATMLQRIEDIQAVMAQELQALREQQQEINRLVRDAMDAARTNRDVLRRWSAAQSPERGQRRRARGSKGPSGDEIDRFLRAMDSGDNVLPMPDPKKIRGDDSP